MTAVTGRPSFAITGASGFLGRRVAAMFAALDCQVKSLGRRPTAALQHISFVLGDPVRAESLAGLQALVHCAYDFSATHPDAIRRINVEGSRRLLDAARQAGVPRLVWVSSISAFPGCRSEYGKAKLAIEKDALAAGGGTLVIRPGLTWSEVPGSTFGNLVAQVGKSPVIPLIGDGSQLQFLVHRDDLAGFIVGYCTGKYPDRDVPVTVAHPRSWSFAELLRAIARGKGREPRLIPLPWRAIWLGLRLAEALGADMRFRSDSVVSLMNQNPSPDFETIQRLGIVCRPFPDSFRAREQDRSSDRS